jgi:REP element-mobilizing transposase RayT
MSRPLRIEYPGAFYHVINRGLERREIFRSKQDYEYFLGQLLQLNEKYGLLVHSYCLMPNHYHLYLETPNGHLSKIMRQLDGHYTQKFNKRHARVGPLMQGRYKAVLIEKDNYSLQLSKYIHLNPVKAKIVKTPEEFVWSSYQAYIGKTEIPDFLKTNWLLGQFNKSGKKAIKAFKQFTIQDIDHDWSPEKETYKGLILGDSDFISQIQDTYIAGKSDPEIPKLKFAQKQLSPEELWKLIASLKIDGKTANKLFIFVLKKYSSLTLNEIGAAAGGLTYMAVSKIAKRLEVNSSINKNLKALIRKVASKYKMSNV